MDPPITSDSGHTPEKSLQNSSSFTVHPVPSIDSDQVKEVNMDFIDSYFALVCQFCYNMYQ